MIKSWWEQLSERDQRILKIGAPIVIVLLFYVLVWSPLSTAIEDRKQTIASTQSLLLFMQRSWLSISRYATVPKSVQATGDILSVVEAALSQQNMTRYLKSVNEPSPGELLLSFKSVPFDQLIKQLQQLLENDGIHVKKLNASKQSKSGIVDARVLLASM